MESINVNTGFGYFKNSTGHIVAKGQLPLGSCPVKDSFTYTEVADMAELDAIEVYQDPIEIERRANEQKIAEKLRELAINELIKDGNWP